jgi:hypothetical protein
MNRTRRLPEEEWYRLENLGWLESTPRPGGAEVFVVEDHLGDIIGFWMVRTMVHIEPIWIREDHRGGLVPRRLWRAVRQFLDTCRIPAAFCMTESPIVADYLTRLGIQELPDKVHLYEPTTNGSGAQRQDLEPQR